MSRGLVGAERALPAGLVASAPALRPPWLGAPARFPQEEGLGSASPSSPPGTRAPPEAHPPTAPCILAFASHARRGAGPEPSVSEAQTWRCV